ncbi:hypothetical protein [Limnoglobus roseus]|uniref:Uncharacterized protein n=1 Tax=Limnoglobus roseus TaxID=2598579 RepID=A0A5C1APK5_9BACT|nr:hypothetical protein [Limnoglobus roseus]QEL19144.1 hypothetical protein PX52LOC_06202 [Limnoglobus roseus]
MASPVPNDEQKGGRNNDPKPSNGPDVATAASDQTNEAGNPQAEPTHEPNGQRTQKEPPGTKPVAKR